MSIGSPQREDSAGGLLIYRGEGTERALLIRVRAREFEIPKGHMEAGESPQQAALREVREETALLSGAEVGLQLGEIKYTFQNGDQVVQKRVTYFRLLTLEAPEFGKQPAGTRELLWVNAAQARSIALVSEDLRPLILAALGDL